MANQNQILQVAKRIEHLSFNCPSTGEQVTTKEFLKTLLKNYLGRVFAIDGDEQDLTEFVRVLINNGFVEGEMDGAEIISSDDTFIEQVLEQMLENNWVEE